MTVESHQTGRTDIVHEDKCRRCGASCHIAIPVRDRHIVVPGVHCRFLSEGSDGKFGCTAAFVVNEEETMHSVYPSGAAFATNAAPIDPPAPG